ncbi:P1 family peptidase [Nocardiopsis potens]|uniref:P1 family peptidase n=1 Tax=Nocardiopsis potens TaxID=1246458 RepID=UPI00034D68B7|nr:P1 family peptidase [Nocardiopsis potens]
MDEQATGRAVRVEVGEGARAGARNDVTDVAGIRVGHAQRVGDGYRTGVTVVLPPAEGAVAGVDVRGAAPGTRETDLLDPRNMVERVHAIVLSGGSAYGLDAAGGVMHRLADAGVGLPVGAEAGEVVPIVPSAVLYDLGRGGRFRAVPDAGLGALACADAEDGGAVVRGSVGAATGALVGGLAGGVGSASLVLADGTTVGAVAAVNAAGSAVDPRTGALYGAHDGLDGEFPLSLPDRAELEAWGGPAAPGGFNTTIGVVATDLRLTKAQAAKLAGVAQDGLARAVRPAHTMVDGDTVFVLSTGEREGDLAAFQRLLSATASVFARTIADGVLHATGRPGAPSYRDVLPSAVSRDR